MQIAEEKPVMRLVKWSRGCYQVLEVDRVGEKNADWREKLR